tara:strand:+ start:1922 stop:2197 length:276 start_codon:yes stop_codon:yes gene_type:complete
MEVSIVIGILILLVIGYFFLGIILKFSWSWAPAVILTPICIWIMFLGGYLIAFIGLFLFILTNTIIVTYWQDTELHNQVEERIEKMFYFQD